MLCVLTFPFPIPQQKSKNSAIFIPCQKNDKGAVSLAKLKEVKDRTLFTEPGPIDVEELLFELRKKALRTEEDFMEDFLMYNLGRR